MSSPRLSFSNALKLGIIFLIIIIQLKADDEQFGGIQMNFRPVDKGYRLTGSVLSEFKVLSLLDCALQCLQYTYEICVGFNYKSVIKTNEANCQLAVKQPDDATDLAAEKDWTFYQVENPCIPNPCHFGDCIPGKEEFSCVCRANIVGQKCDRCRDPNHNFALEKPTAQSATYYKDVGGFHSHLAVDGKTGTTVINQQTNQPQCAHTLQGSLSDPAWWRVDFGEQVPVARVVILNRGDCCWDRLASFEIKVGDSLVNNSLVNPKTKCGDRHGAGRGTTTIMCTPIIFGRYLVIQSLLENSMNICEVEVYCQQGWVDYKIFVVRYNYSYFKNM